MKNWIGNFKTLLRSFAEASECFARMGLRFFVAIYRTVGSQFLGGQCRFHPSCSHYALEALETQTLGTAIRLILVRILKCHPFGSSGWDPVPSRKEVSHARKQSATQIT